MEQGKFNRYTKLALTTVYSEQEEGNFHTQLIPKMVEQFFTPHNIDVGAFILDVGCGQGTFMDCIKALDYTNVIGVTYNGEDVEACNKKKHTTIQADMSDLIPIANNSIDFIWCRQALEHSPYPLFTLYEFNRVLRTGSQMYIEVPAPDCARGFEFNPNHYSILGGRMWAALLNKSGFTIKDSSHFEFELTQEGKQIPEKYICFTVEKHASITEG
jgi:SAM-dependent methyltransferase